MKLATLADGTRDGRLIVISNDNTRYLEATEVARTLQAALDNWKTSEAGLLAVAAKLEDPSVVGSPVDEKGLRSPLPRAYEWVDGSAYLNHVRLVRKARNADPPATLETDPLMYQGGSGILLDPREDIPLRDVKWGLDFEAEVAVIVDDVPMGTTADEAGQYIRLVMIVNDISLRGLIPAELKKGFGFLNGKPSTAFSPFALTPNELGDAWKDGRLHLPMTVHLNDERVGWTEAGEEMHFSFHHLIEHIARSRALTAGTIIGSGTISNEDQEHGISCLAEARMIEIIADGKASTPFMDVGDSVRIEMFNAAGKNLFGTIEQSVVSA